GAAPGAAGAAGLGAGAGTDVVAAGAPLAGAAAHAGAVAAAALGGVGRAGALAGAGRPVRPDPVVAGAALGAALAAALRGGAAAGLALAGAELAGDAAHLGAVHAAGIRLGGGARSLAHARRPRRQRAVHALARAHAAVAAGLRQGPVAGAAHRRLGGLDGGVLAGPLAARGRGGRLALAQGADHHREAAAVGARLAQRLGQAQAVAVLGPAVGPLVQRHPAALGVADAAAAERPGDGHVEAGGLRAGRGRPRAGGAP